MTRLFIQDNGITYNYSTYLAFSSISPYGVNTSSSVASTSISSLAVAFVFNAGSLVFRNIAKEFIYPSSREVIVDGFDAAQSEACFM